MQLGGENTYGDIDERFYGTIEKAYLNALEYIFMNGMEEKFGSKADEIRIDADGFGWGFTDIMNEIYYDYYGEYEED
jgi:hypothetical protein